MTERTLTQKESRMLKSAEKRYIEGKDNETIAKELGCSRSTISNYFASDEMDQFEEYFSDEAIKFLKIQMKQRIEDGTNLAENLLAKAIQDPDARPSTKVKASKQAQKIPERYIKMMQELGVIQKPKERKEHEHNTGDVTFDEEIITERMEEAQEELEEAKQDVKKD